MSGVESSVALLSLTVGAGAVGRAVVGKVAGRALWGTIVILAVAPVLLLLV